MPRMHSANELKYAANILGPDNSTVRASGIRVGVMDLTGRTLAQAQLINSETSHIILLRRGDAAGLDKSCYIVCDGTTYIVDYYLDPRSPRPNMWIEVYCHVEQLITLGTLIVDTGNMLMLEDGTGALTLEDGSGHLILEG